MQLADLLNKTLKWKCQHFWENERTPAPVQQFGVRLHTAGLSIKETVVILDLLRIHRLLNVICKWVHLLADSEPDPPTAKPSWVAVDETAVQIGTKWY